MADPVRRLVRQALVSGLESITTANGYNRTIQHAYPEIKSFEQMTEFPSVNIDWRREEYLNAIPGGHSAGFLIKNARVLLDFHVETPEGIETERNRIVADVDKYFGNNYYLPASGGNATAVNVVPEDSFVWGIESSEPYGGITIPIRIEYKQNILDPTLYTQATTAPAVVAITNPTVAVSVRENIRAAMLYNIQQITTANGFNSDFYTDASVRSLEQIAQFPFVDVRDITETYLNADVLTWTDDRFRKVNNFEVDIYVEDAENLNKATENALWDFEKRIMNNPYIPDSDGYRTAVESMFTFNEPFNWLETNRPIGGITVGLNVYYRQDIKDPTVST